jgi:hypothetical protein
MADTEKRRQNCSRKTLMEDTTWKTRRIWEDNIKTDLQENSVCVGG